MGAIYNRKAVISDVEKYIAENGRFLYLPVMRKPHETLYKVFGVNRRTYFLWLKRGIIDLNGAIQYDRGELRNVCDLQRLLEKIRNLE